MLAHASFMLFFIVSFKWYSSLLYPYGFYTSWSGISYTKKIKCYNWISDLFSGIKFNFIENPLEVFILPLINVIFLNTKRIEINWTSDKNSSDKIKIIPLHLHPIRQVLDSKPTTSRTPHFFFWVQIKCFRRLFKTT